MLISGVSFQMVVDADEEIKRIDGELSVACQPLGARMVAEVEIRAWLFLGVDFLGFEAASSFGLAVARV